MIGGHFVLENANAMLQVCGFDRKLMGSMHIYIRQT